MRKTFGLVLFGLLLLVSLTTICLGKEKTKSNIFDLMKHAPLFGHACNADKFTYIGIYYPSFTYEEQTNKLTVKFDKIIDERTVQYKFEFDCPPFLPLKKQIQLERQVLTATQPEDYSPVSLNTVSIFVGRVNKEFIFYNMEDEVNKMENEVNKWADPNWGLQIPKPEHIPSKPDEKENLMSNWLGMMSKLYPTYAEEIPEWKMIPVWKQIEAEFQAKKYSSNWFQIVVCSYGYKELPPNVELPLPVPSRDQRSRELDIPFIRFLKTEIIEPNLKSLILNLPFPRNHRKIYFYVYLPAPDHYGIISRYELDPELGLKEKSSLLIPHS